MRTSSSQGGYEIKRDVCIELSLLQMLLKCWLQFLLLLLPVDSKTCIVSTVTAVELDCMLYLMAYLIGSILFFLMIRKILILVHLAIDHVLSERQWQQ